MKSTQKWSYLLLFALVLGAAGLMWMQAQRKTPQPTKTENRASQSKQSSERSTTNEAIPDKAYRTWHYIQTHHRAPDNYVGGRVFQNRERKLPNTNANGEKATYYEWDINPKRKGQNRGAERLVSEEYLRAWYTPDHYNTFIELKQ
jgi:ribonuclease T1